MMRYPYHRLSLWVSYVAFCWSGGSFMREGAVVLSLVTFALAAAAIVAIVVDK